MEKAQADYAICDAAKAAGFILSEDEQSVLDSTIANVEMYALLYGYTNADAYLEAMYGHGSSAKSYQAYAERSAIASAYYTAYNDSLTYDDAAIREYEKDSYNDYSSYSYANYYLASSSFMGEDATAEDTDAANAAAKAAAESLLTCEDVDALDAAIATLDINAENDSAASTKVDNGLYTSISSIYREWLGEEDRKEGDIEIFANESTSSDAEGNETTIVNGYYVVMFLGSDDNAKPMANVRHLLVKHEHAEGEEHSDNDMAELKAEADGYLETWLAGDKTEESFIELVKEYSDDSSAPTGGLFEDITPDSAYVEPFLQWSISADRKAGDAEVIETEYGYHVLYYVGDDELSYRDSMIISKMKAADLEAWEQSIVDAVTLTVLDTSKLNLGRIISGS